ncbi:hypothetical protein CLV82_0538 [Zeaxanthinibacter enoshimensis]|uniref:Bulb-type lectin domain-containing protein n=2 Tax=Zeaxanthinibacter enoshimensis TaxID=392009 RepID=A0A4R6TN81_9FLAO|nr:hypothetical protein CLV82_0538 [Zeaxanthinibacter enoshimensis]
MYSLSFPVPVNKIWYSVLMSIILYSCSTDPLPEFSDGPDREISVFSGDTEWMRSYGGTAEDGFHAIITTADGGVAALGYSRSTDGELTGKATAATDYWLMKADADGEVSWSRSYGGSGEDLGQSLIQTADGGYAIIGYAMSADGDASQNQGFHDNWILKLDETGNIEWESSFGFSGHDHAYDLVQTDDGGFFFVGFLDVTAANGQGNDGKGAYLTRHGVGEFWATKIGRDGQLEWRRYYGGTNNDRAHAVARARDGGFVISGFSESDDFDISGSKGSYDFWVIKVSELGELIWERSYGGSGIEISYDIAATDDGGFVIVGNSINGDGDVAEVYGESDAWILKIDGNGNMLWQKSIGGSGFDTARSITVGKSGDLIISGYSNSDDGYLDNNQGENDAWVMKTDASGNLIWKDSFGGSGMDLGFSAVEAANKDILLAGETASPDWEGADFKGATDAFVMRLGYGARSRD